MTLSVLTLVKNRAAHLERLIEGLQRSEVTPDELIVVDMQGDWSPPRSANFPIRSIKLESAGLPLARARNAAARAAASSTLLFLDVDCIPMLSLVGDMVAQMARTNGLICAEVRYLASRGWQDGWNEESLRAASHLHPVRNFPDCGCRHESNPGLFWSLLFAVEREQFLDVGGFDEAFCGYGAEDTDFAFQAHARGVPLIFLGGTGAFHQHHEVFDPPLQHIDDIVRNAVTFHRKWQIWPMVGWLEKFEAAGLIRVSKDSIATLRRVTPDELARARVDRPF